MHHTTGQQIAVLLVCQRLLNGHCRMLHEEHNLSVQVNYKNVMKEYNLGPNGGILTSLNLFATRFDQVYMHSEHDLEPVL